MPETLSTDKLLSHPDVMRVIDKRNPEFFERTAYRPPACEVFKAPATELLDDDAYTFETDREARAQLPHIIENKVQRIAGKADPGGDMQKDYTRKRTIGIVFSGGPAPGGHNVIAGIFDAAKKANPESIILGFLLAGSTAGSP